MWSYTSNPRCLRGDNILKFEVYLNNLQKGIFYFAENIVCSYCKNQHVFAFRVKMAVYNENHKQHRNTFLEKT